MTRARPTAPETFAPLFAALGDPTRLAIVHMLSDGDMRTIVQLTQLTRGAQMTRQALSKHVRILESAGIVRATRQGRETRVQLDPDALRRASTHLEEVSQQWDDALARLKAFVEK